MNLELPEQQPIPEPPPLPEPDPDFDPESSGRPCDEEGMLDPETE